MVIIVEKKYDALVDSIHRFLYAVEGWYMLQWHVTILRSRMFWMLLKTTVTAAQNRVTKPLPNKTEVGQFIYWFTVRNTNIFSDLWSYIEFTDTVANFSVPLEHWPGLAFSEPEPSVSNESQLMNDPNKEREWVSPLSVNKGYDIVPAQHLLLQIWRMQSW